MRKRFVGMIMVLVLCTMQVMSVMASNSSSLPTEAVYDLEKGGTQTFEILDKNNNIMEVTIEELIGKNRVSNGSYKVTYNSIGCWTAGFVVDISNNKIMKAHSPFHVALTGFIRNAGLARESYSKVIYRFNYSVGVVTLITGFQAVISGTTLKAIAL